MVSSRFYHISREVGGRGSPRFPAPVVENFSADLLPATKGYWTGSPLELYMLLRLNRRAQGKHLTSLFSQIAALLLATRVCPVYLVDELVQVVL